MFTGNTRTMCFGFSPRDQAEFRGVLDGSSVRRVVNLELHARPLRLPKPCNHRRCRARRSRSKSARDWRRTKRVRLSPPRRDEH